MSDGNWKDHGAGFNPLTDFLGDFGGKHHVENTDTGEMHVVERHPGQTVGEAIEEGQFVDEEDDE